MIVFFTPDLSHATHPSKVSVQSSLGDGATGWNFSRWRGFAGLGIGHSATVYTDEGDLVLDPFAGSNTTGAVAESLHLRWIAVELVESYLEASRFRFGRPRDRIGEKGGSFMATAPSARDTLDDLDRVDGKAEPARIVGEMARSLRDYAEAAGQGEVIRSCRAATPDRPDSFARGRVAEAEPAVDAIFR